MSDFLDRLAAHGVDTQATLERFMGNEDLYKKILKKFSADTSFADAVKARDEGRDEDVQMHIHTLKGVSANLGLAPIFHITEEMMALFRSDDKQQAYGLFDELENKYGDFLDLIEEL